MKTLRQEDGRQLETTSRKQIYVPTTSYPRAFYMPLNMYQLCSVCTFQQFLTSHGSWKQRGACEVKWGWCIQSVEYYLKIDNRQSHCGTPLPSKEYTAEVKKIKMLISFLPGTYYDLYTSIFFGLKFARTTSTKRWDQTHCSFDVHLWCCCRILKAQASYNASRV